jgi:hypothetical protein
MKNREVRSAEWLSAEAEKISPIQTSVGSQFLMKIQKLDT